MSSYPVTSTSTSGAWRFTAMLGIVAFVLCAGILSWVIITIADLKSGAPGLSVDLSVPPARAKLDVSGNEFGSEFGHDLAKNLTTDGSERAGLGISGWETDLSWLGKNSFAAQGYLNMTAPFELQSSIRPDVTPPKAPSDVQSEPAGEQTTATLPDASADAPNAPKRLAQDHRTEPFHTATPKAHKSAARPYYMEKLVEQGDAGDVTFRYRRRACTPSNMVDVCYMPPENRRAIVVERW